MACISNVLIVGGGIAGLSAAIALSRTGVQCDVVELGSSWGGASIGITGRAADALGELQGGHQTFLDTLQVVAAAAVVVAVVVSLLL